MRRTDFVNMRIKFENYRDAQAALPVDGQQIISAAGSIVSWDGGAVSDGYPIGFGMFYLP